MGWHCHWGIFISPQLAPNTHGGTGVQNSQTKYSRILAKFLGVSLGPKDSKWDTVAGLFTIFSNLFYMQEHFCLLYNDCDSQSRIHNANYLYLFIIITIIIIIGLSTILESLLLLNVLISSPTELWRLRIGYFCANVVLCYAYKQAMASSYNPAAARPAKCITIQETYFTT